jgi:hypothetical protein
MTHLIPDPRAGAGRELRPMSVASLSAPPPRRRALGERVSQRARCPARARVSLGLRAAAFGPAGSFEDPPAHRAQGAPPDLAASRLGSLPRAAVQALELHGGAGGAGCLTPELQPVLSPPPGHVLGQARQRLESASGFVSAGSLRRDGTLTPEEASASRPLGPGFPDGPS